MIRPRRIRLATLELRPQVHRMMIVEIDEAITIEEEEGVEIAIGVLILVLRRGTM